MLTLFENITAKVTDLERDRLIPMLLETLAITHSGNRFTAKNLSSWFRASGYEVGGPRIRKMIKYIRITNAAKPKVVMGTSKGYYLTSCLQDVDDEIESMQGRVDSGIAVIEALKAQRINLIHNK